MFGLIGLIGGLILGCVTFYLVIAKFDSRVWVAGLSALGVFVICAFTGIFGCLFVAMALGVLFKVDF